MWDRTQAISSHNFVSCMYTTKHKHEEKKANSVTIVDRKRKCDIDSLQNESKKFFINRD